MPYLRIPLLAGLLALCASAWAQSPPRTIRDIVQMLEQSKPNPAAVQKARTALEQPPPATDSKRDLIRYWLGRARAAQSLGLSALELDAYRKARDIARDTDGYGQVLKDAARREYDFGSYAEAVGNLEEIIRISRHPGPLQGAYGSLAGYYAGLGDEAKAREMFARSERNFQEVVWRLEQNREGGYPLWIHLHRSVLELHRGSVSASLGRLAEAESALKRALEANAEDLKVAEARLSHAGPGAPSVESNFLMESAVRREMAGLLRQQGRYAEAEILLRDDLKANLARVGRNSGTTARSINLLAALYAEQGRFADAEVLARLAIAGFEKAGLLRESSYFLATRATLVTALAGQERWSDALREFDALRASVSAADAVRHAAAKGSATIAIALVRAGRADEARRMAESLVGEAEARFGSASNAAGEARGALAMALARLGDRAGATNAFAEALRILQGARGRGEQQVPGGLRRLRLEWIVEAYLDLLAQAHLSEADRSAAEAFRVADLVRGQRLQQALGAAAARSAAGTPELVALVRREQDLGNEIAALSAFLTGMLSRPSAEQLPQVMADMRSRMERIRAERARAYREIEARYPPYANLVNPSPASAADAGRGLRAGEALLAFYVAPGATYGWAIGGDGRLVFARSPVGRAEIEKLVARVARSVRVAEQTLPEFDALAAHALYEALLKPVETGWSGARHLIVVPHGALAQLPFQLLLTVAPQPSAGEGVPFSAYRGFAWLVRKAAVTQLPSANALLTLRALPEPRAGRRAFAGFGDPIFGREQAAGGAGAAQAIALRGVPLAMRSVGAQAGLDSARLAHLPRLPDTADEIKTIAAALGASLEDVFLAERANEKEAKSGVLSNRRVLAFATHGLVPGDLDGLNQPALALSAPEVSGSGGDGLLTMEEVLALKLDADWVLLSACNTAAGEGGGAEAVSGLGRAFFFAGARALLASNWPVETVSARILTTETLKRYASQPGTTRAAALREAMLRMIDETTASRADGTPAFSYAHPIFWAPFTLVGDGG